MVHVSLRALGYDGQEGYLLLRRDTAVFATGKAGTTFVHGGNSLQERVIPVLTVSHRHRPQASIARYTLAADALPEVLGYSRLRLRVLPSLQLSFVGAQTISLALRVPERPDVYVTLKEAINAEVQNQEVRLAIGDPWVEVLFDLRGPHDERTRVELFHPEGVEQIEPHTIDAYFNFCFKVFCARWPVFPVLRFDWIWHWFLINYAEGPLLQAKPESKKRNLWLMREKPCRRDGIDAYLLC
jgi:hypothetical protein